MIKQVKLKVTGGTPVPTGTPTFIRRHDNAPRDTTKPYNGGMSVTSSSEPNKGVGVYINPPKPRPHILQGWKGEI